MAGVTAGHGRPTTAAERTSNVKGLWNEQLSRRGSVVEAPPGTLYRSTDVTNDAGSRGARNTGPKNRGVASDGESSD